MNSVELVHSDDRELVVDAWLRMLEHGRSGPLCYRRQHKDGSFAWYDVTLENRLGSAGSGHVVVTVAPSAAAGAEPGDAGRVLASDRMPRHGTVRETLPGRDPHVGPEHGAHDRLVSDEILHRAAFDWVHPA